jgi:hypothetical protein
VSAGVNQFGLIAGFYVGNDGQEQGFIADASKAHNGFLTGIRLRTVGGRQLQRDRGGRPPLDIKCRVEIFRPFSWKRLEE